MSAILLPALAACGILSRQAAAPAVFPPAPLPMYSAGDSYAFDDGTVDAVVSATNDAVRWRNASGARFVTTRDVMLPPLAWADATEHGSRKYQAPQPLFPLSPGGAATVSALVTQQPNRGGRQGRVEENWQCQVGGAQRLRIAAGSFDTVRVDCAMTEMPGGRFERRSFFYAPAIGYYVRRIDRIGDGPPRSADLKSYTTGDPPLPDSAMELRVAGIQHALESVPSGTMVTWEDPATQASGSVEPLGTMPGHDGNQCRDFHEQIAVFGRSYGLAGEACRQSAGDWQVLNVAPG